MNHTEKLPVEKDHFNKVLRVCVVSPLYNPFRGGLGRQAVALTEKLESSGVNVFVIARKMTGLPEYAFNRRIPIYRVWALKSHIHHIEKINVINIMISLSFCLSAAITLFRNRKSYEIVHFHGASLPLMTNILLLKLCRKKILAKVAAAKLGAEAGSLQGKYSLLGDILIWMLKKVDCFIATSKEIEDGLLQEGYEQRKIVRIPNFIDQHIFHPPDDQTRDRIRKQLGFTYKRIVTFSGRLVERKGPDILLDAWKTLTQEYENILLIILGGGPLESNLKEQCRVLGIEKDVTFYGFVNNVYDYLAAADIFVFPSFQEGLPNAVLEAMACGLPVISSRIGGVIDMIRNGENGLLFEPGNTHQLAGALKRLLSDPEYASTLGNNALKTVRENYDLNVIADKYIELYTGLSDDCNASSTSR